MPSEAEERDKYYQGIAERMTALQRNRGALLQDVSSRSDYLRPPFPKPFPRALPVSREASEIFMRGFASLPQAYQNLLRDLPPEQTAILAGMSSPELLDALLSPKQRMMNDLGLLSGFYIHLGQRVPLIYGTTAPGETNFDQYALARTPETASHELTHLLISHLPMSLTFPMSKNVEEQLASQVTGRVYGGFSPRETPPFIEQARKFDEAITRYGLAPKWMRKLGLY